MKTIIVKTQKELDKIKDNFEGEIHIAGSINLFDRLFINATVRVVPGGKIYFVKGGEINSVEGGKINYVYGGEINSVEGGEINSVEGGKINYVRGGKINYVEGGEINYVFGIAVIVNVSVELKNVFGTSIIMNAQKGASINAYGYATIRHLKSASRDIQLKLSKTVSHIIIPDFIPSFENYYNLYPINVIDGNAILYKAVHKKDGGYVSDYDGDTEYFIGETKIVECETENQKKSCGVGLHVAFKGWAISFGAGWSDMALLECEVPIDKIVVAEDCDGKVRTSELKVLREVPKEEW